MVRYVHKELTEAKQQTVVCPVNLSGVVTDGLMKQLILPHEGLAETYREACRNGSFRRGKLMLWKKDRQWVLLFPVRGDWQAKAEIACIEKGLGRLAAVWRQKEIKELAFPKLGCEEGGLEWTEVIYVMENRLARLEIDSWIYIGEPEFESLRLLYR